MFRRKQTKKEDLEVNITDGKNVIYDEEIPIEEMDEPDKPNIVETDSESEIQSTQHKSNNRFMSETPEETNSSYSGSNGNNIKASSSRENTLVEKRPKSGIGVRPKPLLLSSKSDSDSDSDDGLMIMDTLKNHGPLPDEYDPEKFNSLNVSGDVKDLFQYITKYTPQHLNLDYKFKPFVPDYIPAVGDIDAFLKVVQPDKMLSTGDVVNFTELGLNVLDEPAANQSDSALLHLQLRAVSVTTNKDNKNMIIKKIENVEKNTKTIDKWIIDISDLHRAKPPPMVKYANPMPDIDSLMQEWPQLVELRLRKDGFPSHKLHCTLAEYIQLTCAIFDIPVYEKKIQSLHLLFSLFIAIKSSQLYNLGAENPEMTEITENIAADQLILD